MPGGFGVQGKQPNPEHADVQPAGHDGPEASPQSTLAGTGK
jgi:hypothetical protein